MASKFAISAIATAAIAVGIANNVFLIGRNTNDIFPWLVDLLCTCLLIGCIGKAINGHWSGVFVSARNRLSLSKLQMTAWTILVLSTLVAAASHNLHFGSGANALNIAIDPNLLIVMGIATTSLVASPAVISLKETDSAPEAIARKDTPDDASWLDLFRGDLAETADTPDLSKIQQFLVSLVVIGAYAVMIGAEFLGLAKPGSDGHFAKFPPMSDQLVWLIGISHAGYIAYKAAQKPTAPQTTPAPAPANNAADDGDDGAVG